MHISGRARLIDRYNHEAATLNYMALDHLSGCLEANDCLEGQETVVILTSHHFCECLLVDHADGSAS